MTPDVIEITMAFSLGLLGSAHCFAMCGGIACLMSVRQGSQGELTQRIVPLLNYNAGRIVSYSLIGLLLGLGSGALAGQWQSLSVALRSAAGLMLLLMGLHVAGLTRAVTFFEQRMMKLVKRFPIFIRPGNHGDSTTTAFACGLSWGWLPCGLVYSSLIWAVATTQSALGTATLMFFFGVGTLPAMLATGIFAEGLRVILQLNTVRLTAGLCIVLYGVWTLLGVIEHSGHSKHDQHDIHGHPHHHGMTEAAVITPVGYRSDAT